MSEMSIEEKAYRLWKLLDDIDTIDDAARGNDAFYRDMSRHLQRSRFQFMTGEEYERLYEKYESAQSAEP